MTDQRLTPFNAIVGALPASTPFIAPETIERESGISFTARLGANESLLGPSPKARDAMRAAVDEIGLYDDPECFELRAAIAQRESVDIARVIMGSGIDDLLGSCVRMFLNPGDRAATTLGCYPTVTYHLAGYGARAATVPFKDYRNDLVGLADMARQSGARLAYLANPDNPTGSWYSGADVARLIAQLPDQCVFLLDEAYSEFAPPEAREGIPTDDPRLIRLRTFSKAYGMAGARIAYAIAPLEVAIAYNKIRLHFGVNRIAQVGALAALQDHPYLVSVVEEVARGREEYAALAREVGLPPLPSATNFVAMDTGSSERARALVHELAKRGVFIRTPASGPTTLIRVSVGDAARRARFANALREICGAE